MKPAPKSRLRRTYLHPYGSWLNIAECELSAMTSQCVKNGRFATIKLLVEETQAWAKKTNQKQKGVNWQFSIEKARHKLKSIYPKIKC